MYRVALVDERVSTIVIVNESEDEHDILVDLGLHVGELLVVLGVFLEKQGEDEVGLEMG